VLEVVQDVKGGDMMMSALKSFIKEEDGLGTVEIVIIIAVLVGLAIIFRKAIFSFLNQILSSIFGSTPDAINKPSNNEIMNRTLNVN